MLGAMVRLARGVIRLSWLLPLCSACERGKNTRKPSTEKLTASLALSASLPSAAPSALSSAATNVGKPLRCDQVTVIEAARQLMSGWNTALNAHDADALAALYAPEVSFYGRHFTRAQVVAAKRTALAATPGFNQQLSDVRVAPAPEKRASVTFVKAFGAPFPVRARLVVACASDGSYAIAAESDAPSDALSDSGGGCEAAMYAAALALPEVTKQLANATPDAPSGGVSYPTEGTHYSLALGFHHEDRFESAFFVDWLNGAFTVSSGEAPLVVPPASLARVKAACPK